MARRLSERGAPHRVISVLCAAGAGNLVWWDQLARAHAGGSLLAPTPEDLWVSIGLGGAAGAAAVLALWGELGRRPGRPTAGRPSRRPPRWAWSGLLIGAKLAVWAAVGWCVYAGVFPLPALLAANAVAFGAITGDRPARPRRTDSEA